MSTRGARVQRTSARRQGLGQQATALVLCRLGVALPLLVVVGACGTAGRAWVNEPLGARDGDRRFGETVGTPVEAPASSPPRHYELAGTVISEDPDRNRMPQVNHAAQPRVAGRVLGTFRNTYYDFPAERDYSGPTVPVKSRDCETIRQVPRTFFEALCVQGSGTLGDGATVSFARRDCSCAEVCPRTKQRICFDRLARADYPWGRGSSGTPITPLLTVAVDPEVIPLGTPVYIPEYDGLPRTAERDSFHDGCFIAQDRGLKVKGKQVDVFTGNEAMTRIWNNLVPSNQGVRVVIDDPKCARAQ